MVPLVEPCGDRRRAWIALPAPVLCRWLPFACGQVLGPTLPEAAGRACLSVPGPFFTSQDPGGMYRLLAKVAVGLTGTGLRTGCITTWAIAMKMILEPGNPER